MGFSATAGDGCCSCTPCEPDVLACDVVSEGDASEGVTIGFDARTPEESCTNCPSDKGASGDVAGRTLTDPDRDDATSGAIGFKEPLIVDFSLIAPL